MFSVIISSYEGRIADPFEEFVVMSSIRLSELSERPDETFWQEAYLVCFI